ncbi:unnamed protein product [Acanthoscelides obtectus]|uniref:Chromo domain-containing protein n=1 Tax=Acanthoscelides obtectus TaxID=200917 RepID=A0A9P0KCT7_ACAOB|nr:unnamed protein product [Acanthoscelides obtectus]CAK1669288.1 hypothetical protein AOBTE_LOCUS26929 [Acanthoscelides obtectus]
MDILSRTNAYRRNFEPNTQIQGSTSYKYRNIIRPYLHQHNILKQQGILRSGSFEKPPPPKSQLRRTHSFKHTGQGMLHLSNKPIDYIYVDDPNELVGRLRLLLASQYADWRGDEILGGFYAEELQKVKYPNIYLVEKVVRRKGSKVLVKYLGLDSSYNSWINKSNLLV